MILNLCSSNTKESIRKFISNINSSYSSKGEMSLKTVHTITFENSTNLSDISSNAIDLVLTSPPYPAIEMWDEIFSIQNPEIRNALTNNQGLLAFELMHKELDKVWYEVFRVLKSGGIACINIGDATRKIGDDFQLYSNHSRILKHCLAIGFQVLPSIIWRKPTNAPNKFMGSGMLPPSAYVTLEHEYILILRKNGKRSFKSKQEKEKRRRSAYFWEERNQWFSDVWFDLRGTGQKMEEGNVDLRKRSGAFPFELAYRLINMFSIEEDTILDPFLGTGTTTLAAMVAGRNSKGFEIDNNFWTLIQTKINHVINISREHIARRLKSHRLFIAKREEQQKDIKYINERYNFPVITKQETELRFLEIESLVKTKDFEYEVMYEKIE